MRIKYACLYVIVEKLENLLSLPLRAISTSLSPKLAPCECLSVPVRRAHRGCVHLSKEVALQDLPITASDSRLLVLSRARSVPQLSEDELDRTPMASSRS